LKDALKKLDEEQPWFKDIVNKGVQISLDALVCDKYQLGTVLGKGGFGSVYEEKEDKNLVVKCEYGAMRSLK
jgi:hypothetical protein